MTTFLVSMLLCSFSFRASPPTGAVAQTWNYDAATKVLTLQVVNTSGKDITAYHIFLTVTYADGSVDSHSMSEDYLPLMVSASISAGDEFRSRWGNGTFAVGTKKEKVVLNPAPKDVGNVNAVVDVVVYADQTADVQNEDAFNHLIAVRKGMLLAVQQANNVARESETATDPKAAAATEMERLANVAKGRNGAATDPETYTDMFLHELSSNVRSASDLEEFTRHNKIKIGVITPHTQLKKAVQP
jgi:hypothetical protein